MGVFRILYFPERKSWPDDEARETKQNPLESATISELCGQNMLKYLRWMKERERKQILVIGLNDFYRLYMMLVITSPVQGDVSV